MRSGEGLEAGTKVTQCRNMSRIKRGETGSTLRHRRPRPRLLVVLVVVAFIRIIFVTFPSLYLLPPANLLKPYHRPPPPLFASTFRTSFKTTPLSPELPLSVEERSQPLAYYLYDWQDGIKLSVHPKCNNIHYYANVRTTRAKNLPPRLATASRELASYFCYLPSNRVARLPSLSAIKPTITDHLVRFQSDIPWSLICVVEPRGRPSRAIKTRINAIIYA